MAEAIEQVLWHGGLHTALHESRLVEGDLQDMENAIVRDGVARLDRRYDQKAEVTPGAGNVDSNFLTANDFESALGAGYGKFQTGDASEQYIFSLRFSPVDNSPDFTQQFLIDLTLDDWVVRRVIGGSTPDGGDWFYSQFANYLYGVNESSGIGRKKLAEGSDGTGDWTLLRLPSQPSAIALAPTVQPPYTSLSFVGGTISASSGLTGPSIDGAGRLVCPSNGTAGAKSITITFDTSPDLRPNLQYRDILVNERIPFNGGNDVFPDLTVIEGTNETEAIVWKTDLVAGKVTYRLQNIARTNRDVVTAFRYEWVAPAGSATMIIYAPRAYGVWLSLDTGYNPGSADPAFPVLRYSQAYFNQTTGFEGPPSTPLPIQSTAQSPLGDWRDVTMISTAESGVSHIRLYRVVNENGADVYYRLTSVNNAGSPVYRDKLPMDEVRALDIYTPSELPATGVVAICSWQRRSVIAEKQLVRVSRLDDPLKFEPLTGAFDLLDPGRGLTFYPDDKQAERNLALIGQDDLYIVTDFSVRALFGSTPDNWRLIRLPSTEGACGPRAACAYGGGCIVLTPSGLLLYFHTSLSEPKEIGERVRPRAGNEGLKEIADWDAVVEVRPDGQIEVRGSNGRYFVLDDLGQWRKGTHTDATKAALFVSGLPIRCLGVDGHIYEGDSDEYDTDNGVDVEFSLTTRRDVDARRSIVSIGFGPVEQTIENTAEGSQVQYPRAVIYGDRDPVEIRPEIGKRTAKVGPEASGWGLAVKLIGGKDQVFEDVRTKISVESQGEHL